MRDYTVIYSVVQCKPGSTVQCTVEPGLGQSAEPKVEFVKWFPVKTVAQPPRCTVCNQVNNRRESIRSVWTGMGVRGELKHRRASNLLQVAIYQRGLGATSTIGDL